MTKKDLSKLQTDLSALAGTMPTQRTAPARAGKLVKPVFDEEISQFSFGLRKSLRKQLSQLAMAEDVTMRAFVLNALKEKGLDVTDEDLLDLRKMKG